MNIESAKPDLFDNFRESKEYREAFVEEGVYTTVAFQIAAMREQRGWSQKQLGQRVRMAQERVSILEDPNADTKPTLTTLLRLAAGFDCGLEVRFIPFGRVLENAFRGGRQYLEVPGFEDEMRGMIGGRDSARASSVSGSRERNGSDRLGSVRMPPGNESSVDGARLGSR